MNKKEIAQQFTRQMLEQKPEKVQQPESQEPAAVQTKPKSALQEEVEAARKLLMEIQILYNKAQDNYKKGLEKRITETAHQLQQLEALAAGITFQIKMTVASTEQIRQDNNRVGSRWLIRVYLIAVLSAICSALTTLIVIWLIRG
jgi:uncharacterized membrane protein